MTWPASLIALAAMLVAVPAGAQTMAAADARAAEQPAPASRYVSPLQQRVEGAAIAAYGPFRVLDDRTAALVGIIDSHSPQAFTAMLAEYPALATLEFVEAPGTHNDLANLALGRMIRARGLATQVGEGGSVRSGAVELFLAGITRSIAPEAEFAVHGWLDDRGLGAEHYPLSAPEHRRYLDYYAEMGMAQTVAEAFYAMTNSVPFEQALWLTGAEMIRWLSGQVEDGGKGERDAQPPRLAYLDFAPVLP